MSDETPAVDTVSMQVRSRLRELTLPLREQLAEIDKRLVAINRERDDLLTAKREITKTIDHLEPSQAKANGAGVNANVALAKKKLATEQFLRMHREEIKDGVTASELNRMMKAEGVEPVQSPSVTLKILKELHTGGVVRADRIVKGGAQLYVLVGK